MKTFATFMQTQKSLRVKVKHMSIRMVQHRAGQPKDLHIKHKGLKNLLVSKKTKTAHTAMLSEFTPLSTVTHREFPTTRQESDRLRYDYKKEMSKLRRKFREEVQHVQTIQLEEGMSNRLKELNAKHDLARLKAAIKLFNKSADPIHQKNLRDANNIRRAKKYNKALQLKEIESVRRKAWIALLNKDSENWIGPDDIEDRITPEFFKEKFSWEFAPWFAARELAKEYNEERAAKRASLQSLGFDEDRIEKEMKMDTHYQTYVQNTHFDASIHMRQQAYQIATSAVVKILDKNDPDYENKLKELVDNSPAALAALEETDPERRRTLVSMTTLDPSSLKFTLPDELVDVGRRALTEMPTRDLDMKMKKWFLTLQSESDYENTDVNFGTVAAASNVANMIAQQDPEEFYALNIARARTRLFIEPSLDEQGNPLPKAVEINSMVTVPHGETPPIQLVELFAGKRISDIAADFDNYLAKLADNSLVNIIRSSSASLSSGAEGSSSVPVVTAPHNPLYMSVDSGARAAEDQYITLQAVTNNIEALYYALVRKRNRLARSIIEDGVTTYVEEWNALAEQWGSWMLRYKSLVFGDKFDETPVSQLFAEAVQEARSRRLRERWQLLLEDPEQASSADAELLDYVWREVSDETRALASEWAQKRLQYEEALANTDVHALVEAVSEAVKAGHDPESVFSQFLPDLSSLEAELKDKSFQLEPEKNDAHLRMLLSHIHATYGINVLHTSVEATKYLDAARDANVSLYQLTSGERAVVSGLANALQKLGAIKDARARNALRAVARERSEKFGYYGAFGRACDLPDDFSLELGITNKEEAAKYVAAYSVLHDRKRATYVAQCTALVESAKASGIPLSAVKFPPPPHTMPSPVLELARALDYPAVVNKRMLMDLEARVFEPEPIPSASTNSQVHHAAVAHGALGGRLLRDDVAARRQSVLDEVSELAHGLHPEAQLDVDQLRANQDFKSGDVDAESDAELRLENKQLYQGSEVDISDLVNMNHAHNTQAPGSALGAPSSESVLSADQLKAMPMLTENGSREIGLQNLKMMRRGLVEEMLRNPADVATHAEWDAALKHYEGLVRQERTVAEGSSEEARALAAYEYEVAPHYTVGPDGSLTPDSTISPEAESIEVQYLPTAAATMDISFGSMIFPFQPTEISKQSYVLGRIANGIVRDALPPAYRAALSSVASTALIDGSVPSLFSTNPAGVAHSRGYTAHERVLGTPVDGMDHMVNAHGDSLDFTSDYSKRRRAYLMRRQQLLRSTRGQDGKSGEVHPFNARLKFSYFLPRKKKQFRRKAGASADDAAREREKAESEGALPGGMMPKSKWLETEDGLAYKRTRDVPIAESLEYVFQRLPETYLRLTSALNNRIKMVREKRVEAAARRMAVQIIQSHMPPDATAKRVDLDALDLLASAETAHDLIDEDKLEYVPSGTAVAPSFTSALETAPDFMEDEAPYDMVEDVDDETLENMEGALEELEGAAVAYLERQADVTDRLEGELVGDEALIAPETPKPRPSKGMAQYLDSIQKQPVDSGRSRLFSSVSDEDLFEAELSRRSQDVRDGRKHPRKSRPADAVSLEGAAADERVPTRPFSPRSTAEGTGARNPNAQHQLNYKKRHDPASKNNKRINFVREVTEPQPSADQEDRRPAPLRGGRNPLPVVDAEPADEWFEKDAPALSLVEPSTPDAVEVAPVTRPRAAENRERKPWTPRDADRAERKPRAAYSYSIFDGEADGEKPSFKKSSGPKDTKNPTGTFYGKSNTSLKKPRGDLRKEVEDVVKVDSAKLKESDDDKLE